MNVCFYEEDTESIIQSEPYEVTDCILYNTGTTGTIPSMIKRSNTVVAVTSDSNGIYMNNRHETYAYYVGLDKETSSTSLADWIDWIDTAFQFEFVSQSNNAVIQFRPQSSNSLSYQLSNSSQGDIIRLETKNNIVSIYNNNTLINSLNLSDGELVSFRFALPAGATATIKNVAVYLI